MAEDSRFGADWIRPAANARHRLKLYNSLTRRKDDFLPMNGNSVTWYVCGPTVYDVAHMGHARSYISFDILRRVLRDYFGYDVLYVMNITDIDDKIIKRARQRYLLQCYLNSSVSDHRLLEDIEEAKVLYKRKLANEKTEEKRNMFQSVMDKLEPTLAMLNTALKQAVTEEELASIRQAVTVAAADVLSDWLDAEKGHSVTDQSIFESLSRQFEQEFNVDMAMLNVLPADVVTRVSEYITEIVSFIEKIMERGFAYEASGSVYFDTVAFRGSGRHVYGKLVPEAIADSSLLEKAMQEGEGELSVDRLQEKRSASDFALWKRSKPGEPFWPSPWGNGRPGWHIECSVMATAVCGPTLDIHSGGFDLRFPHHDNELAQTEAHFDHQQWVNYFLHAGTLKIAGLKMSKSLKNFITIKEALKDYTARQLRLLFLMHDWSDTLDYSTQSMERAVQFERMCNEFFLTVSHYLRKHFDRCSAASFAKLGGTELTLQQRFLATKLAIDKAMCDNVDTRSVLDSMRNLISQFNVYIEQQAGAGQTPCCLLLRNVAVYITRLLRVFGVVDAPEELGFSDAAKGALNQETLLMPYLTVLSEFRQRVRDEARQHNVRSLLEECDRLRDEVLVDLGVRLEDRKDGTIVKLADRETLIKEREQRERLEREKRLEKERLAAANEAKRLQKEQQRRVVPSEMFRREADKYSAFDEQGIPTHDGAGEEISKKQRKKLEKLYEAQCKLYEQHLLECTTDNGKGAMTKKQKGRKRKFKDMDQIHDELRRDIVEVKRANYDPDLPGEGQFPCVECDRLFESAEVLEKHTRSKGHKRRVKEFRSSAQYTQAEADAAAGVGSYAELRNQWKTVMDTE